MARKKYTRTKRFKGNIIFKTKIIKSNRKKGEIVSRIYTNRNRKGVLIKSKIDKKGKVKSKIIG